MSELINKLVTVRTYTTFKGWTVAYTYRLMNEGRIKWMSIDGVKFVIPTVEELNQIQNSRK